MRRHGRLACALRGRAVEPLVKTKGVETGECLLLFQRIIGLSLSQAVALFGKTDKACPLYEDREGKSAFSVSLACSDSPFNFSRSTAKRVGCDSSPCRDCAMRRKSPEVVASRQQSLSQRRQSKTLRRSCHLNERGEPRTKMQADGRTTGIQNGNFMSQTKVALKISDSHPPIDTLNRSSRARHGP